MLWSVFTKPWSMLPGPELADLVSGLGFTGAEVPVRDNAYVTPGNAAESLFLLGRWIESRALSATALEWSPAGVAFVITQGDTGKTFTLPSGSVAELRLVGSFRWSAPQATPAIVALTPEALPTSAGYEAWKITATGHGTAVIESTGSPICPPGHVCAQYVVLFRVSLVVP